MKQDFLSKTLFVAEKKAASFIEFHVSEDGVAVTSNLGTRKSTRNYTFSKKELNEIERRLKSMDGRIILFLRSVDRIEFMLRDGRKGVFSKTKSEKNTFLVDHKRVTESAKKTDEWLAVREHDMCSGIGFMINRDKKGRRVAVSSDGCAFFDIFENESTDYGFCISAITGETDGKKISSSSTKQVVEASVMEAFEQCLLPGINTMSVFSILSHISDTELREGIAKKIKSGLATKALFHNVKGRIALVKHVIAGTPEVTGLFSQNDVEVLFGGTLTWVDDGFIDDSTLDFFSRIGMRVFDRERFLDYTFDKDSLSDIEKIIEKKNDRWLMEFYVFCAKSLSSGRIRKKVNNGLRAIRSARDSKGKMRYPKELLVPGTNDTLSRDSDVLKRDLIGFSSIDGMTGERLASFFIRDIGMQEYTAKPEIEKLLERIEGKRQSVDVKYCEKLLKLARFDKENPREIDFSKHAILPYRSKQGVRRTYGYELIVGKPFSNLGVSISNMLSREYLLPDIRKMVDKDDLEELLYFAESCGAFWKARIQEQSATLHVDFEDRLKSDLKKRVRDTNYDYIIPDLQSIIGKRSITLNKIVWDSIINLNDEEAEKALIAEYSTGNREVVKRWDSSLICILRDSAWVPNRSNKLFRPSDIKQSQIKEGFVFKRNNPILKALQFGSKVGKKSNARAELDRAAKKEGLILVDEKEYQEFIAWKSKQKKPRSI